ncbi:fasciclin domain-containing protein [Variovorax sp. PCZ-1]|uniref:fasciclin domain-containing protein n=1 Tax=Variovorax sp. PCZ-1 TaxID=2835533 RepID=UPI001BCEBDFA|nr:fasciclin domain-containing protein [Variovorax sp. PCZ-1]MBS7809003.1 fasciclin domain-containing protein [Variovorax sp. PCZ-1]
MKQTLRRQFLKTSATFGAVAASSGLLVACGGSDDPVAPAAKNIVETAQATPSLSILVEAVIAANLTGALSAPGTLTVFAPTNDAFTALLGELGLTKAQLLANTGLLTKVLQYHVLGATVKKANIPLGKAIDPIVPGTQDVFKIDAVGANVVITDGRNRKSNITATDISASNGVVHVIDKVILPADKDIVTTAQSVPDFSILVEAVVAAGLVPTLQGTGPFTVFAPTNAAFAAALSELNLTKAQLLGDIPRLTKILTYHVVSGRVLKADVPVGAPITTVQTETFSVSAALAITDQENRVSNITATDVLTTNGVIHTIDKVILPNILP